MATTSTVTPEALRGSQASSSAPAEAVPPHPAITGDKVQSIVSGHSTASGESRDFSAKPIDTKALNALADVDAEPMSFFVWSLYKGATLPVLNHGPININNKIILQVQKGRLALMGGYLGRFCYATVAALVVAPAGILYHELMCFKCAFQSLYQSILKNEDRAEALAKRAWQHVEAFGNDFEAFAITAFALAILSPIFFPVLFSFAPWVLVCVGTIYISVRVFHEPIVAFTQSSLSCTKLMPAAWDAVGLNLRSRRYCELLYKLGGFDVKDSPLNDSEIKLMLNISNQISSWDDSQGCIGMNYLMKMMEFLTQTDRHLDEAKKQAAQKYLEKRDYMNEEWTKIYRTISKRYPTGSNNFIVEKTNAEYEPVLVRFIEELNTAK